MGCYVGVGIATNTSVANTLPGPVHDVSWSDASLAPRSERTPSGAIAASDRS